MARQKNKQILRKALLEEQEIQREEGVYDPEYLAELSIFYSKDVCVAAYNTGLSDEHSVQEFVDVCNTDIAPMVPRRMKRAWTNGCRINDSPIRKLLFCSIFVNRTASKSKCKSLQ